MEARDIAVAGAVQGVGFRPFVFRLAHELCLGGFVRNDASGVLIQVTGTPAQLDRFVVRLQHEAPAPARVTRLTVLATRPAAHHEPFRILASDDRGTPAAVVMADLATCPACLRELNDPRDRRHRYPFINCTHCGPRFSIIEGIPYDRIHTTMRGFTQCPACQAEYDNPADRRFHAQPNACPVCGPRVAWWNPAGDVLAETESALQAAVAALRAGAIVAVKGLGGFHLLCDARSSSAVLALRERKRREEKPFALMAPSLAAITAFCSVGDEEAALLLSPAAPITLLNRNGGPGIADAVAPGNPCLGVMLPYTPLHHLLLQELGFPLVATSGNLSDEPICTDEHEAVLRLRGLADFFLVHNRPIARPLDDSVVRLIAGKPCILRRARGYAPLPIPLAQPAERPAGTSVLAVGAHMKTTVTLLTGTQAVVGAHIGDLDTLEARRAFARAATDLPALYATHPTRWACDRHPDYASSVYAREHGRNVIAVQHHHAHVASCMAEHGLAGPVLGAAWDGTGLGDDGTLWGGEFLRVVAGACRRIATVRGFALPGGDHAARKPVWSAVGALLEHFPDELPGLAVELLGLPEAEVRTLTTLAAKRINAPRTTSVGRWFDVAAALTGLCRSSSFEGQAAMMLEWSLAGQDRALPPYPFDLENENGLIVVNLRRALMDMIAEQRDGRPAGHLATRFHHTLAEVLVAVARTQAERKVVLSGGCFQNRYLAELCIQRLRDAGFTPYVHQLVPPNDGGISLGQAWVAAYGD
jgi:hydrogenase maturation protein HypF